MAQGDRSLATSKLGRKGPFLFPRTNANFSSGRYRPPSKNAQYQGRLFRNRDPYAGSNVMQATLGGPGGVPGSEYNPLLGRFPQPGLPAAGIPEGPGFGPDFLPPRQPIVAPGLPPGGGLPPGTGIVGRPDLTGLEGFAGMTPEQLAAINEIAASGPLNPNQQIAGAARLTAQALAGNPFISRQGLLQMGRGFAPNLNQLSPAFARYTSPVLQQTLQGLYRSIGVRPEEQQFTQQIFTPRGLP